MINSNIPAEDKRFDILIIGAGPAGLTSAIYGGRAELRIGFIEGSVPGGKMTATDSIQNYPGFENIAGGDLALSMFKQARNNNAKYIYGWVNNIFKDSNNTFIVSTSDGKQFFSKVVIIATGMKEKKLKLENEDKYENNGISYCAICDGSLYANQEVAVIGGGNSAIQESLYLSKIVKKIYLIHRRDVFKADAIMLKQLKEKNNVEFLIPYQITELVGNDKKLTGIKIVNLETNEEKLLNISCLFPYIGFNPSTNFVENLGILNENKQIITNKNTKMTKIEGLYAVGDCTEQNFRQITTANSDGTIATLDAIDYINKNAGSWSW